MRHIAFYLIFFVFSIGFATAQNGQINQDNLNHVNICHIDVIFKKDLINDKSFLEFLKPYIGCLLPNLTIDYDKDDGRSIVVSMPDDAHMTVYVSDLRLTLLQLNREERAKKAEAFFHRAFSSLLGEEVHLSLNNVIPVIRSTDKIDKIKYLLNVPEITKEAKQRKSSPIPYKEIATGIVQAYVIDQDEIISYVSNYDLMTWNVSLVDLQKLALENLRRRLQQNPIYYEKNKSLTYVIIDNYFDSSLAVLPELWNELAIKGNGNRLVVAFFAYDTVIYTFENDKEGISTLRNMGKDIEKQNDIISKNIYVWDNGKWSLFK